MELSHRLRRQCSFHRGLAHTWHFTGTNTEARKTQVCGLSEMLGLVTLEIKKEYKSHLTLNCEVQSGMRFPDGAQEAAVGEPGRRVGRGLVPDMQGVKEQPGPWAALAPRSLTWTHGCSPRRNRRFALCRRAREEGGAWRISSLKGVCEKVRRSLGDRVQSSEAWNEAGS